MRKQVVAAVLGAMLMTMAGTAQAAIIVNDWQMNLTGIDGIGPTVVKPISEITYVGLTHVKVNDTNLNGTWSTGETALVNGLLNATSFQDTGGSTIFGTGLASTYQMTFDFTTTLRNTGTTGITTNFTHIAAAGSTLNIYVDGPTGGVTPATQTTGAGYQDGVKIATFDVVPGNGGVFTPATFDGSDDASFRLTWAMPGVILDAAGNDMTTDPNEILFAITDSNFDADPTNQPNIGFTINAPSLWPYLDNVAHTPTGFFAEEDGSARLGTSTVPEPSTMILLGAGLLGLGIFGRKRSQKL